MKNCKLLILVIFIAISCSEKSQTTAVETQKEVEKKVERDFEFIWEAKPKTITDLDNDIKILSDSLALEFVYPIREKIPKNDSLIIVHKLKQKGFKIIDSGRGNWMNGPRIISYTLESNDMACRVDKLYYSDSIESNDGKYKVSERLACLVKQ